MAFRYSPKIVTDGLVFYVDAANSKSYIRSGVNWNDLSGSFYSGELINGPTFDFRNGGSIVFDGSNYVSYGDVLNFERTDSFSINIWSKFDDISTTQILIGKWNNKGYEIFLLNPGKIGWTLANSGGGINQLRIDSSNNTLSIGEIFNLCVTYNGNSSTNGMCIYKNGVELNTSSIFNNLTSNILSTDEFRLGANSSINPNAMDGNIFNAQVYNKALTSKEIKDNYDTLKNRFKI